MILKHVVDVQCPSLVQIVEVVQSLLIVLLNRLDQVVVGIYGSPLIVSGTPWVDAICAFLQVHKTDRPTVFEGFWRDAAEKVFRKPWAMG